MRALLAACAGLVLSCGFGPSTMEAPLCTTDDQCEGEQICFADGCGDPGKDIVVEVTPGAVTGQLAQDFAVEKVATNLDFQTFAPPVIQGVLTQEGQNELVAPYNGDVQIRASGESQLIPGRSRSFQYTVKPDQGAYQVPVAAGLYAVSLTPVDALLPPRVHPGRAVEPGDVHELNASFPTISELLRIDGRLLQSAQANVPVQATVMEIQAVHPDTGQPLSQPARVSSGQATSTGDFFLYVEKATGLEEVHLLATPQDPMALVPRKTFVVPVGKGMIEPLELGEYGSPVTVTGRVVDTAGNPVADATVFLEGEVGGGGSFRSPRGSTGDDGAFQVSTLPSAPGGVLTLFAVPPPTAAAGVFRQDVEVPQAGGALGEFTAPDKVAVRGHLVRPDGGPALGVMVRAEPVAKLDDHPLPSAATEGATDDLGAFSLKLDPAIYRLDFVPTDFNPRVSRFITVRPTPGATGVGSLPIELPDFQLSRGRKITGTISSLPRPLSSDNDPIPAPNASVKFFRIVTFEGKRSHVLLAEALADGSGHYQVVLPTR